MSKTLAELRRLKEELDSAYELVSRDEFVKAFEEVVKAFNKLKAANQDELEVIKDQARQSFDDIRDKAVKELESFKMELASLAGDVGDEKETNLALIRDKTEELNKVVAQNFAAFQQDMQNIYNRMLRDQENGMNFIRDKVRSIQKFDQDELREDMMMELRAMIPEMPEMPEMPTFEMPPEYIDALAAVQAEHKQMKEELETLRRSRRLGGGGHTDIGIIATLGRIVKTETPSGAINGANTDYTLTAVPNAILAFHINGQAIPSADYSLSGKTITFTTALDSSLSGTQFECVYV